MIDHGTEYIDQHSPELIQEETFDDGYVIKYYPFELQVSNGNHHMIWSALGLEWDYCGGIHPTALLKALDGLNVDLMVRETVEDGNMIHCGVDAERVNHYTTRLREIAMEACKREEEVYWA